jgi:hypothetical protein
MPEYSRLNEFWAGSGSELVRVVVPVMRTRTVVRQPGHGSR